MQELMREIFRASFENPLLLWLTIAFLLVASVVTLDKRLSQAKLVGNLPPDEPSLPNWVGALFLIEKGLIIALLVLNWKYGLFVYAFGFVLAVLPVLETVGNILMAPFKQRRPDSEMNEEELRKEIERLQRENELLDDPETIYSFGLMSLDGDGVPQDAINAAGWFRIAAEAGHAKAQHNLALLLECGEGVPQDYFEAAKWYHSAARQGLASSQNNLGALYEMGDGVRQDNAEALKWYQRAAENGDPNAPDNLNRLEANFDTLANNQTDQS